MEEREAWSREGKVVQGGKYYYNRNRWNIEKHGEYGIYKETSGMRISMVQKTKIIPNKRSTLVAFTVGERYQPGGEFKVPKLVLQQLSSLCKVIGAHTDSPVLKVKPVSAKTANGYIQVM